MPTEKQITDDHAIATWLEVRAKWVSFRHRCLQALQDGRTMPLNPETLGSAHDRYVLERKAAEAWFETLSSTQRAVFVALLDDGQRVGIAHLRDKYVHSESFFASGRVPNADPDQR